MDEILNAVDSVFAELTSNDAVISEWDSASVDLTSSSLVNEVLDHVSGWESESDMGLNHSNHVPCGFVKLDEYTVVQLSKSEELQNLLWLGGNLVDTKEKIKQNQ